MFSSATALLPVLQPERVAVEDAQQEPTLELLSFFNVKSVSESVIISYIFMCARFQWSLYQTN